MSEGNDFEKAFSDFLERKEYDDASNAVLSLVRSAFKEGYKTAGGNPPRPNNIINIEDSKKADSKK